MDQRDSLSSKIQASQTINELVRIEIENVDKITLVAWQNKVSIVRQITLHNDSDQTLEGVTVKLISDPPFCAPWSTTIDRIPAHSLHVLHEIDLKISSKDLLARKEEGSGCIQVHAGVGNETLAMLSVDVAMLPPLHWPGVHVLLELLGAFIIPNSPALDSVLKDAAKRLKEDAGDEHFDAYKSRNKKRVLAMIKALYEALQATGISRIHSAPDFEESGQKVRTPAQVIGKSATPLDLNLVFCALLERLQLHPLLVVTQGQVFVGVWLSNFSSPQSTLDDSNLLRKRVRFGELVILDAPLMLDESTFERACLSAEEHLKKPEEFHFALDVCRVRKMGFRPFSLADDGERVTEGRFRAPPIPSRGKTPPPKPGEKTPKNTERNRLQRWKDQLLDLTLRNRMLNFRSTARVLELPALDLARLEDSLADVEVLELFPRGALRPRNSKNQPLNMEDITEDGVDLAFAQSEQAEGRLRVDLTEAEFNKRIIEVYRSANLGLKESGAITLYLALGMLRWFESPSSDVERLAPLLLIPVELIRGRGKIPWKVRLGDDEVRFNSTLLRKWEIDFGIDGSSLNELPEDESGIDVPRVLDRVRALIAGRKGWEVLEHCVLAQFSFVKFLMWLDLEAKSEQLVTNPVVKLLMDGGGKMAWGAEPIPANRLDTDRSPAKIFNVVDADPSQLQAILAAADGASFVLQGPPGTGKSQTITNLIAQLMAEGRKVLFVSEKMAALNVVHDRLSRVGLGPFCLELHSQKSNKKAVMGQFREAFEALDNIPSVRWEAKAKELQKTRAKLNAFAEVLAKQTPLGGTVQSSLSNLIALKDVQAPQGLLHGLPSEQIIRDLRIAGPRITRACAELGELSSHPLKELCVEIWDPVRERAARSELDQAIKSLESFNEINRLSAKVLRLPLGSTPDDFKHRLHLCQALLDGPVASQKLLQQRPDAVEEQTRRLLEPVKARAEAWSNAADVFKPDVLNTDQFPVVHQQYQKWASANFVIAWLMLWVLGPHRKLSAMANAMKLPSYKAVLDALDAVSTTREESTKLKTSEQEARALLGVLWDGPNTNTDEVEEVLARSRILHQAILMETADLHSEARLHLQGLATENHGLLAQGSEQRAALTKLKGCLEAWQREAQGISETFQLCEPLLGSDFNIALEYLVRWRDGMGGLRDWSALCSQLLPVEAGGLKLVTQQLLSGEIQPAEISQVFERILHGAWWDHTLSTEPRIRDFRGLHHDALIKQFQELDTSMMELARHEIRARIAARAPRLDAPGDEMALLRRQLGLKTRHKSLRELFKLIPETLGRLKPCVLMSPLSVAQYLDPSLDSFDVVIFDEASQIPPWDAIGALARGKQAVIVGDSKQLPPTNFFGSNQSSEDADELDLEELESILEEAIASGVPEKMLRWHYRSQHESLIAFSNHHYYDNNLRTFPNSIVESPDLGVHWRHVPDGFYDRGKSRTNRAEAEAVVAEMQRILSLPNPRSVGVVTFSEAQQRLIEDLVDVMRQKNPALEPNFVGDDAVFIKNLENVQGDERDVMLFSIGYAADRAGKLTMNFGPLNRQGGERRLNVAVTRARQLLIVFSTLRAEQIDLSRTNALGARHLKNFLSYAEHGLVALDRATQLDPNQETESPFEAQVKAALEAKGWTVHCQIGCSGYRIDLAVVDPEAPGSYLLGIECDGATYHSSATARERDRLRQQVLEGLGWRIHRIWSTDWWFQRPVQMEKTLRVILAAQESARDARLLAEERRALAAIATETLHTQHPADLTGDTPPIPSPNSSTPAEDEPQLSSEQLSQLAFEQRLAAAKKSASVPPQADHSFVWPMSPVLGDSQKFAKAEESVAVQEVLANVIRKCGPIFRDDAYRCVIKSWQIKSLGKSVRRRLDDHFGCLESLGFTQTNDGVFWPDTLDPRSWRKIRIPLEDDQSTKRTATQIPSAELANTAEWVLQQAKIISSDDLARETAGVFGFKRMSQKVKAAMHEGIDLLIAESRATREDDRIRIVE